MSAWETTSTILVALRDTRDETAWPRLVDCFHEPLVRLGVHAGMDRSGAEDFAQDVLLAFVRAYRAGRYDRSRGRLRDWLFGIAWHVALAARQRQRRTGAQRLTESEAERLPADSSAPDEGVHRVFQDETHRHLFERALRRVREETEPATWSVFEAVALRSRSADDVALEYGVTRNAVYLTKRRILTRVRDLIRRFEDLQ